MTAATRTMPFTAKELKLRNNAVVSTFQVMLIVIALVVVVVTAGPEPSDLITLSVAALLYLLAQSLGRSHRVLPEEVLEGLADCSREEIAEMYPDKKERARVIQLVKEQILRNRRQYAESE